MNLNKLFKIAVFILFTQFGSNAIQGMVPVNAPVEIYFLPKNFDQFNQRLMGLLDNAKDHVFVAMYWLTNQDIISKLISLKQRGINVQIVFDESANKQNKQKNVDYFIQQLLKSKIIPYVLPNIQRGKMHNKFVVIDGRFVITGSANFTPTVFNKTSNRFVNNENILIFNSREVAAKYEEEFLNIQDAIAKSYVNIIADKELGQIERWIREISSTLYVQDLRFRKIFERNFSRYGQDQQRRLARVFDLQLRAAEVAPEFSLQEEPWDESDVIISPVQSVPAIQRPVVVAPEFSSEEEPWSEDDVIISPVQSVPAIQYRPGTIESESSLDPWTDGGSSQSESEPNSDASLESEFSSDESWEEPEMTISRTKPRSSVIDLESSSDESWEELLRQKPPAPFAQHPRWEPLTYSQKLFLESRGVNTYEMSKQRASQIIGDIKRAESRPY
jgi:hypothetical protein